MVERLTGDQKVAGSIPVWGLKTYFLVCDCPGRRDWEGERTRGNGIGALLVKFRVPSSHQPLRSIFARHIETPGYEAKRAIRVGLMMV